MESARGKTDILALTPGQRWEALRSFAASGKTGARLYDALIGKVARAHAIGTLLTWNTRRMAGLFPDPRILTLTQYVSRP